MFATATKKEMTKEMEALKTKLKATWMTGHYDVFARFMEADAVDFYRRLGFAPGVKLLDVGCGAGQLALIASRAGAEATGCDIATNWLEKAQARAKAEGLTARFEEGDAEALPYEEGSFDVVTSLVGAMFAPRPNLVAKELARVCRPGGTIAMINWTAEGFIGQMFRVIAKHIAPSGMPSPVLWGDEATVRERFGEDVSALRLKRGMYHFDYPFAPDGVVDFFRENYGPMTRAFASLGDAEQAQMHAELSGLWACHNRARGERTKVEAEYLEVVATRV